jgi:hypothetical protein
MAIIFCHMQIGVDGTCHRLFEKQELECNTVYFQCWEMHSQIQALLPDRLKHAEQPAQRQLE